MTPKIKLVLILDDDHAIRSSLGALFNARGYHFQAYANPDELFHSGQPDEPACLLLDHHLGNGVNGLQVYEKMRADGWDIPTIFLTAHWNVQSVVSAIRAGLDGFLAKPFDPEELIKEVDRALLRAVELIQKRREVLEARVLMGALTPREREIVGLVISGMLNKEIADRLGIALVTVKVHRGRAMKKLGAGNPAELAKIVILAG